MADFIEGHDGTHLDYGFEKVSARGFDEVENLEADVMKQEVAEPIGTQEESSAEPTVGVKSEPTIDVKSEPVAIKCALYGPAPPTDSNEHETSSSAGGVCLKNLNPKVRDLVLWRDLYQSLLVSTSLLLLFISVSVFSVITVLSYLLLATLTVSFCFHFYWQAVCTVKKSNAEMPLKKYMNQPVTVDAATVHRYADLAATQLSTLAVEARKILFVEDVLCSFKCVLVLWCMTYIGGWFNGTTLLITATVVVFTVPKLYSTYQTEIDHVVGVAHQKCRDVWTMVESRFTSKKQA